MDEKKNIDRLFQEKFKDYEVSPNAAVWKNIEKQLMKKKKRRIIPLWLQLGGAAAILLLLASTGFWYFNNDTPELEQPDEIIITKTDSKDKIKDIKSSDEVDESAVTFEYQIDTIEKKEQEENSIVKTNKSRNLKTRDNVALEKLTTGKNEPKVITQENENIAISNIKKEISIPEKEESTKIDLIKKIDNTNKDLTLEKIVIAQQETINDQKKPKTDIQKEIEKTAEEETVLKSPIDKWSIGSTMAPIYYNTLANGSPIDPALADNKKNGDGSISYGLKVNYKLSDKLSLQSGIHTLELGYATENVTTLLSSSLLGGSSTNINTNVDGVSIAALSTVSQNSDTFNQRTSFDLSGTLDQTLNYVEIPVEAKYNILHKKLGVNLIGGFSTYFLYRNEVSITSFGKTTTLGEASNINSLNFSGNLGVDFDYNISKKLYINVSPMFKYQFNTFSENAGGFKPYYLGVYTGLNFRF